MIGNYDPKFAEMIKEARKRQIYDTLELITMVPCWCLLLLAIVLFEMPVQAKIFVGVGMMFGANGLLYKFNRIRETAPILKRAKENGY